MVSDPERPRPARAVGAALAAVALVAAGAWARCADFRSVFPLSGEVELVPADSHYYVRFALLQLHAFPRFVSFDPYVNFPTGARILWPPLHALGVALAVKLGGLAFPERGAAFVDPALSVLWLAALAVLGRRWLRGARSLGLLLVLALTPSAVESGLLGCADHHVHEPFLAAATALALGHALEARSRRAAWGVGVLLGLGRLLTPLAFAYVPVLALAVPLAALVRREAGAFAAGVALRAGGACAACLAVGVLAFGEARSLEYEYLSGFHPLFALAVFLGAAALAWLRCGDRRGRWALPVALAVGLPLVPQLLRAAGHLGRADPLLAVVGESQPLLSDPRWALSLLGAPLLALPVALWGGLRRVVRERAVDVLPALLAATFLGLAAAMQARFAQALAGALAVLLPLGLSSLLPEGTGLRVRRMGQAVLALGALSLAPQLWPLPPHPPVKDVARVRPTLRWMRANTPPASADPYGPEAPRYGVAASYLLGHFLTLWAERPEIASTFSQAEVHQAGNRRAGAVFAATDDEAAYQRAKETGARYVLATPSEVIVGFADFDRPRSLLTHLLDAGGMATAEKPATAHFRLVFDSGEERLRKEGGPYARLFEAVPGAVLRGRGPAGEEVVATLELRTNRGAKLRYERKGRVDDRGDFALRVAYATTAGGAVTPEETAGYVVRIGGRTASVTVREEEVLRGAEVDVRGPEERRER